MERLNIRIKLTGINNKKSILDVERRAFNELNCNYKLKKCELGGRIHIKYLLVEQEVVRRSYKSVVKDLVKTNMELNKIGITLEGVVVDNSTLEFALFDNMGNMFEVNGENIKGVESKTMYLV